LKDKIADFVQCLDDADALEACLVNYGNPIVHIDTNSPMGAVRVLGDRWNAKWPALERKYGLRESVRFMVPIDSFGDKEVLHLDRAVERVLDYATNAVVQNENLTQAKN
jgi:hypothetical protein